MSDRVTAIVLLGGLATRMYPLSLDMSKAMLPFVGKPLLTYLIDGLAAQGFTDVILTSEGRRGEIRDYFSSQPSQDVTIRYSTREAGRGTAGTIKTVLDDLGDGISEPFFVIYGDSLLRADYRKMLQFHCQTASSCTILYHRPEFGAFLYQPQNEPPRRAKRTNYGVMELMADQRIRKIIEKPTLHQVHTEFSNPVANAAVYILTRDCLRAVPSGAFADFPRHVFPVLIAEGLPCYGFDIEKGYRADIGTLDNYYKTQMEILDGAFDFGIGFPARRRGVWVGRGSRISAAAGLTPPTIVCEHSVVESCAQLKQSIIGNNVHVGRNTLIEASIVMDDAWIGKGASIVRSIVGANCRVADGVSLPPNTVLGHHCLIGVGSLGRTG